MKLFAKTLLSIAAIQYGIVPLIVDLTVSHVFNHGWLPHARFHMVWLLVVGSVSALYVLGLIWLPAKDHEARLKQAGMPGAIILSGFFAAMLSLNAYGGALSDPAHQIKIFGVDGNLLSFSFAAIFQIIAMLIIWRSVRAVP